MFVELILIGYNEFTKALPNLFLYIFQDIRFPREIKYLTNILKYLLYYSLQKLQY